MLVTLKEVLSHAQKQKYAVGLFNTVSMEMLEAAISAAEECSSPVIIGTAEVLLPYGDLDLIAPSIVAAAKRARVPVVVHYDHGLTFDNCMRALKLGFSSVMFDGSTLDTERNMSATREMARICHAFSASVEGEIGHVGGAEGADSGDISGLYTSPRQASEFVQATGVDALAVAIGTAHGTYKQKPVLDLERLANIKAALPDMPLVLHGGSGLTDDDFKNTVARGISKINIFTDLCQASSRAFLEGTEKKLPYLEHRNFIKDTVKTEIIEKMKVFGSVGKA